MRAPGWRAVNEVLARLYAVGEGEVGRTMRELTRPTVGLRRAELRRALAWLVMRGVVQPHGRLAWTVFAVDEVIEAETRRLHDLVMEEIYREAS